MARIAALAIIIALMGLALFAFGDAVIFADARSSMTFGFLLLTAYLIGDVLSRFKLPKITGYILAGILFGPHLLDLVSAGTVRELKLIVFFGVGGFVLAARPLLPFLDGKPQTHALAVALLLGTFAVARSPSSAIAIISECKARGPFTEMVLGVTVVMDVLVIIVFAAMVSISQLLITPGAQMDFQFIITMVVHLLGSILAGLVLGWVIRLYMKYVRAEVLVFILAVAFMVTLFSRQFAMLLDHVFGVALHLEPMLICVTAGFWVRNFTRDGGLFMETIDRSSLPIYVIFFSLAGAALKIDALSQTWLIALLLVAVRSLLIWIGAYLGGSFSGDPSRMRRMSGLSFITQAGVSLGLAGIVMRSFPEWGAALSTAIVAIVALNQIIGPIAFKFALGGVGEARASPGRRTR